MNSQAEGEDDAPIKSLGEALRRTRGAVDGEKVAVGEIVSAMGAASHSVLMLLPAMIVVTPMSGIPGVSSVGGIIIALVAVQMTIGREHLWLPQWILNLEIPRNRICQGLDWLEPPGRFVDRHTRRRMSWLTRGPGRNLIQVICLCCGLAMPFFEIVPFTSSFLAGAVLLFATALVVRDGLIAALGLVVLGLAGWTLFHVF